MPEINSPQPFLHFIFSFLPFCRFDIWNAFVASFASLWGTAFSHINFPNFESQPPHTHTHTGKSGENSEGGSWRADCIPAGQRKTIYQCWNISNTFCVFRAAASQQEAEAAAEAEGEQGKIMMEIPLHLHCPKLRTPPPCLFWTLEEKVLENEVIEDSRLIYLLE